MVLGKLEQHPKKQKLIPILRLREPILPILGYSPLSSTQLTSFDLKSQEEVHMCKGDKENLFYSRNKYEYISLLKLGHNLQVYSLSLYLTN